MDAYKRANVFVLSAFCVIGSVISQADVHLTCLPDKWTLGETVKLKCVVQKSSYPSKCTSSYTNTTLFRQRVYGGTFESKCTVTDILSSSCPNQSGACRCGTHNSTHYIFEYEFPVEDSSIQGYWDCNVPCFAGLTTLTTDNYDCDNRKVVESQGASEKDNGELLISTIVLAIVAVALIIVILVLLIHRHSQGGNRS